jgi:hypothetical protein
MKSKEIPIIDLQEYDKESPEYKKVFALYGKTHKIEKRAGTAVFLPLLKDNQSIVWGDGKTFHWLLTEL